MREQVGVAASVSWDAATKGYVDALASKAYGADSDAWQQCQNFIGGTAGTPVSGTLYLVPYDVGPGGQTIKGLGAGCTTAVAGGTVTYTIGIYRDKGTGGAPDFTALLGQVAITAAATGNRYTAFGSTLTLAPGRYWLGFLYVATAAPTTAAQFTCLQASLNLWHTNAFPIGSTPVKAHAVTGLTTLPTTAQTLTPHGGTSAPVLAARIN